MSNNAFFLAFKRIFLSRLNFYGEGIKNIRFSPLPMNPMGEPLASKLCQVTRVPIRTNRTNHILGKYRS